MRNIFKKKEKQACILLILGLGMGLLLLAGCSQTVVEKNGRLQVIGTQLCNQNKEPVQLRGIAIMDIGWFKDYINVPCFKWLRDDWGCSLVRAVMWVETEAGHPRALSEKDDMIRAVQTAIDAGLYVIIDWHILQNDKDPLKYKNEAVTFFSELSALFKDKPNVIYEICNEPNGDNVTWKDNVVPYATEVITAIRKNDPLNVILVGTPNWSQWVDVAADDPLPFTNIMYTCHFYAGSHRQELRDRVEYALKKNAPIFISEWGITNHTATGTLFPEETFVWIDFLNERKISWANWCITSRKESSAAVKYYANSEGGWNDGELSESGLLTRCLVRQQYKDMVLFADGFESENYVAGNWVMENAAIKRDNAYKGGIAALLKKQGSLSKIFATVPFKNVSIQFAYQSVNWSGSDTLKVEWFDGNSWQPLASLEPSTGWSVRTITLPEGAADNYDFQFRFVSAFQNQNAEAGLDEVSLIMDRIK